MSIKITIPNTSSDTLTFGSANTPTAAQIAGIDSGSSNGQLAIYTTASGTSTERVRVDASGNVGIGTASPSCPLNVVSAVSSLAIAINGRSSDNLGAMYFYANNGSTQYSTVTASATEFRLSSVPASAVQTFYTNASERMRIDSSGNVLVTNPAGLGYGTGSGGTVTQATSKSTAVTLNKPTGQITTNNAALAAGATVSFTVNNSLFTTSDLVLLAVGNGSSYTVIPQFVGSGTFNIRLTNTTAGSLSEAVQINFALIKGASA